MGPLLLGAILLFIYWLVPLPPVLHTILLIAGVIAVIYGLYVLFVGAGRVAPGSSRYGSRYWY